MSTGASTRSGSSPEQQTCTELSIDTPSEQKVDGVISDLIRFCTMKLVNFTKWQSETEDISTYFRLVCLDVSLESWDSLLLLSMCRTVQFSKQQLNLITGIIVSSSHVQRWILYDPKSDQSVVRWNSNKIWASATLSHVYQINIRVTKAHV